MQALSLPATLDALAPISEFITDATAQAGLDDHAAWQVQLAVDEAATNIIQHGYDESTPGIIDLGWEIASDELVVTLRDLRGYSYPEIARMLGLPEGTVKSALNRGRTRLMARMAQTLAEPLGEPAPA